MGVVVRERGLGGARARGNGYTVNSTRCPNSRKLYDSRIRISSIPTVTTVSYIYGYNAGRQKSPQNILVARGLENC